ncbi:protein of unknown function [Methylocaldum szegediense]|uniref:Uncharacterized protein n=1 Tax=Methylocaldum szegediense TaxID=73780 RepID=A0ABM9HZS2_9GAMM|nr:protein of unknown function [Methylocaldum szegediense]
MTGPSNGVLELPGLTSKSDSGGFTEKMRRMGRNGYSRVSRQEVTNDATSQMCTFRH